MAEKRVSLRLAAVGRRQVRAELEGVGEAGTKRFGRLSREMDAANQPLRLTPLPVPPEESPMNKGGPFRDLGDGRDHAARV